MSAKFGFDLYSQKETAKGRQKIRSRRRGDGRLRCFDLVPLNAPHERLMSPIIRSGGLASCCSTNFSPLRCAQRDSTKESLLIAALAATPGGSVLCRWRLMYATCFLVIFWGSTPLLTVSAAQSRHGDALLVSERGLLFLPEAADHLDFPRIALAERRRYRYRVSELPQVIYPNGFSLDVPQQEDELGVRHDYAWSPCVVRASLLTSSGRVFYRRTFHLGRDRAGSSVGRHGGRAVYFPFTDYSASGATRLPQHFSYVLDRGPAAFCVRRTRSRLKHSLPLVPKDLDRPLNKE